MPDKPIALDTHETKLLVGLANGTIMECLDYTASAEVPRFKSLMKSHSSGAAQALVTIPNYPNLFITGGDDNRLLLYNTKVFKCIGEGSAMNSADKKVVGSKAKGKNDEA